jgi:predicted Zn-dependent peptidase
MKLLYTSRGLPILFRRMDSSLVDLRYVVRCGALDEIEPSDYGACHALEHMLFAGTKKRTWRNISDSWEKLGSEYNAHTHLDKTTYEAAVLKASWKEAYEVLADVVHNPTLPEDRWEEVEKGAIISEIQGYNDSTHEVFGDEILKDALGGNIHPIIGYEKTIRKTDIKTLRKFYDKHYCGKNIVLLVTGDLSEEQLLRTVEKYDRVRETPPPERPRLSFSFNYRPFRFESDVEQILVVRCKPIQRPVSLRKQMCLMLGDECLSQYLFEELRELRGLCYSADSGLFWKIPQHLFLEISIGTDKDRKIKTQRALTSSLDSFMEKGLTKERIENARKRVIFGLSGASEDIIESANAMWGMYEEGIYSDPFKAGLGILSAVNAGEVRKSFSKALEGNFKTAILAPGD